MFGGLTVALTLQETGDKFCPLCTMAQDRTLSACMLDSHTHLWK